MAGNHAAIRSQDQSRYSCQNARGRRPKRFAVGAVDWHLYTSRMLKDLENAVEAVSPGRKRTRRSFTLFVKILLMYVISLVPLYLLVLLFFNQARSILTDAIAESIQAEGDYFVAQFETEVTRIYRQMLDMVNDDDLQRLSAARQSLTEFEYTTAVNRLQTRLMRLRDSSQLIRAATVFVLSDNRRITAGPLGERSVSEIPEGGALVDGLLSMPPDGPLRYEEDTLYMRVVEGIVNRPRPDARYAIGVTLSQPAIIERLARYGEADRGSVVMISASLDPIASYDVSASSKEDIERILADNDEPAQGVVLDGAPYLSVATRSEELGITLVKFIPVGEALQRLRVYQVWVLTFTAAALLIVVPFAGYAYRKVRKPLRLLVGSFEQVEKGNLETRIQPRQNDEFDAVFSSFNNMVTGLGTLVEQVAEEHSAAQKAELRQLQSQINPHFLYNSYFLLHRLIRGCEWDHATDFSRMMGRYFQYITRSTTLPVSLEDEVGHARIYASIQAQRFAGRIVVQFDDLPERCRRMRVPPLILQPLIENSFVHSLENMESDGKLQISFVESAGGGLHITVDDNGQSLSDEALARVSAALAGPPEDQPLTGLLNINYRLRLMYQHSGGVAAGRSPMGGLRISIRLPSESEAVNV